MDIGIGDIQDIDIKDTGKEDTKDIGIEDISCHKGGWHKGNSQ